MLVVIKTGGEWDGGGLHQSNTDMTGESSRKGTVLKFDSNKMIGSQRSRPNLIGLTERASKASFVSRQYEYQGLETSVR